MKCLSKVTEQTKEKAREVLFNYATFVENERRKYNVCEWHINKLHYNNTTDFFKHFKAFTLMIEEYYDKGVFEYYELYDLLYPLVCILYEGKPEIDFMYMEVYSNITKGIISKIVNKQNKEKQD